MQRSAIIGASCGETAMFCRAGTEWSMALDSAPLTATQHAGDALGVLWLDPHQRHGRRLHDLGHRAAQQVRPGVDIVLTPVGLVGTF
jgi:hypothetical protein